MKLNPEKRDRRILLMESIAKELSKKEYTLKGGTALLLAYKLDRFSEDLDFDSNKKIDLEPIIKKAAQNINFSVSKITLRKNTETTQRYMIHYNDFYDKGNKRPYPLKLETSFRNNVQSNQTAIHNGIQVYKIDELVEQKSQAFLNRMNIRDFYDVAFLVKNHPQSFKPETVTKLIKRVDNHLDLYSDVFNQHKVSDHILMNHQGDNLALELSYGLNNLSDQQELLRQSDQVRSKAEELSIPDQYDQALAVASSERFEKAEYLENKLESLIQRQMTTLNSVTSQKPGRFSLPGKTRKWNENLASQHIILNRLKERLRIVHEIKEGITHQGSIIDKLARNKLIFNNPILANRMSRLRETERKEQLEKQRKNKLNKTKTNERVRRQVLKLRRK